MKIGILSDLHLYFDPTWNFVPEDDVYYICAGDISESRVDRNKFIKSHEGHMFTVLGNHDFYRESFWVGPGHTVEIGGLKIAGATLWTEMNSPLDWHIYKNSLIDAKYINFMTEAAYNEAHKIQKEFLLTSNADIIVSHHAPTRKSIHPRYENNAMNHCFASDMEEDIMNMHNPPKLWIHGHTHDSFDYMIGNTRVVCHPKGYPNEINYIEYKPWIVEI